LEVVEALGEAAEVAGAVGVGVLEVVGIDLIEDGVAPPGSWRKARADPAGTGEGLGWRCCSAGCGDEEQSAEEEAFMRIVCGGRDRHSGSHRARRFGRALLRCYLRTLGLHRRRC
jgi:hypothetical protein